MALRVAEIIASNGKVTAWCAGCKRMFVLASPEGCRLITLDANILDVQRSLKCSVCKMPGEVWVWFPTSDLLESKGRLAYSYNNTPYEHGHQ